VIEATPVPVTPVIPSLVSQPGCLGDPTKEAEHPYGQPKFSKEWANSRVGVC